MSKPFRCQVRIEDVLSLGVIEEQDEEEDDQGMLLTIIAIHTCTHIGCSQSHIDII